MSAFDMQVKVMGIGINAPNEEAQKQGVNELEVVLTLAQLFPTPQGLVPVPLGVIRFPLAPEDAINIGGQFVSEGEKLPKTSDLQVVQDISQVENIARADQAFRKGQAQ